MLFLVYGISEHIPKLHTSYIMYFFYKNSHVWHHYMKLDILVRLTPQITTIIWHNMKKNIIKGKKKRNTSKYGGLDQNLYINKTDT